MIRVAAVGDIHVGPDSVGLVRKHLAGVPERADVLLIAGDLTKSGAPEEAELLAAELQGIDAKIVAVLGNHDHHSDREADVARILSDVGVVMLEGDSVVIDAPEGTIGVAGVKGFGGGFTGASGSEFGEREMKAFVAHTRERAEALEAALTSVEADVRIALMHYSPTRETLQGEPPEIFPFLGSYLLAEAVDRAGADLVLHGHAHRGREHGLTPGGIHVRNVAQTVIGQAFAVYGFNGSSGDRSVETRARAAT